MVRDGRPHPVRNVRRRVPVDHAWELEAGIVRPYLFTRGRTEPAHPHLAIETMLRSTSAGRLAAPTLPAEQRRTVELCQVPQSVAEVAARLRIPLGIVRVLVADLYAEGLVDLDEPQAAAHDIALLRRLIDHIAAIA
jgi:DNA-directed RNA polymerase specialized sigma24 family protein